MNDDLLQAIKKNDANKVRDLLDQLSVEQKLALLKENIRNREGAALIWNTESNNIEVVKVILAGLSAEQKFELLQEKDNYRVYGRTALIWASRFGWAEVVKLMLGGLSAEQSFKLLKGKANNGMTALMFTSIHNHVDAMKTLLATNGLSAKQRSELLLEKDSINMTAAGIAAHFTHTSIVELIMKEAECIDLLLLNQEKCVESTPPSTSQPKVDVETVAESILNSNSFTSISATPEAPPSKVVKPTNKEAVLNNTPNSPSPLKSASQPKVLDVATPEAPPSLLKRILDWLSNTWIFKKISSLLSGKKNDTSTANDASTTGGATPPSSLAESASTSQNSAPVLVQAEFSADTEKTDQNRAKPF